MIWRSFVNYFLINVSDALHLLLRYNIIPSIALVDEIPLQVSICNSCVYYYIQKTNILFCPKNYNIMPQSKY